MKGDAWKFVLIGFAAVALGVSVALSFGGDKAPPQRDWALYVDITSGQLYELRQKGNTLIVPMYDPNDRSKRSLFPIQLEPDSTEPVRDSDGSLFILPKFIPESTEYLGYDEFTMLRDRETGKVETLDAEPIRISDPFPSR